MPTETALSARPIAVTMGEPAGIGPDITLTAFANRAEAPLPAFALLADPELLGERARRLGLSIQIAPLARISDATACDPGSLPVLPVKLSTVTVPGSPTPLNAPAVLAAIEMAVSLALNGQAAAVVTNPIAKRTLHEAGFNHPGHTEFLAELAERATGRSVKPVMMLASDVLRVVPATVHIPLRDVPGALSVDHLVDVGEIVAAALAREFAIEAPRIAFTGLNPHAGEGGSLGHEDEEIVRPAVETLCARGHRAAGPFSADTLFHAAARKTYDAVVAMYHDQALIPVKTLSFDTGVNVTLGLPFVRTSPDHGTAFDIAGTGKASPESFVQALRLAARLAQSRSRMS
ncbi:MAG: 4-hydroxythreonine-4-phosphate dehydrogenase PdxA [Hyphomicrobiaceae bacterium]